MPKADGHEGTNAFLRSGEGEVLKVRFGNEIGARVIAEYKTTPMGTGWHLGQDGGGDPLLAFLGSVPWKEAEAHALQFVKLLVHKARADRAAAEASGAVNTLSAEIRGRAESHA